MIARGGQIVGRGWHEKTGEAHAEISALAAAGEGARDGTAYVTLEPCSHHGRTPPCTAALIEAGIREVVAATRDPNPEVNGRGLAQLEAAGVTVKSGLMKEAADELNDGFISRIRRGRPWVRVKLAHSLDGRTALASGESRWISSKASRLDVQQWRARSGAILTGIGTVRADDPSLNVRLEGHDAQPLRVIVDSRWQTPPAARLFSTAGPVLVAGRNDREPPAGLKGSAAELLPLAADGAGRVDLGALLSALAAREINEVQVEAGPSLCGALLDHRLLDELLLYCAPSVLGDTARGAFAIAALEDMGRRFTFEWADVVRIGSDLRLRLRPLYGDGTCSRES